MSATPPELDQFRQTFFAESAEMLSDMEEKLDALQTRALAREELDAIFRAVHSIKAGAGMFGYKRLVDFTHGFEALLDRMRDGRMLVNALVAGLIVRAADALAELVAAAQRDVVLPQEFEGHLSVEIQTLLNGGVETRPRLGEAGEPPVAPAGPRRVEIAFKPRSALLRHANEPLLLIRELATLGELQVTCDASRLPSLTDLDPEDACLAWNFSMVTDVADERLREVFEFVEDDAEISLTGAVADTPAPAVEDFGLWIEAPPAAAAPSARPEARAEAGGRNSGHSSIRVDLQRVDRLVNMVGELVISQAILKQELVEHDLGASAGLQALEILTRDLQECVMAIRMQPVKSVFARMPRLVRDVSERLGKKVRLVMSGEHTELDKTVIEELSDPLTHMLRNSVDHGIELPEDRAAAGKTAEGLITLSAAQVGGNILITLEDDGSGINRTRLLQKAVEKGLVAPGAALSDDDIVDLIFAPGFSTAAAVSDLSGRGVGMDVVRRNIQKIGGRIQVSSVEGQGTRFTLMIPLTLAVLDGMLVSVGGERYILPLTSIIESFRPATGQLRSLGSQTIVNVRGECLGLIHLGGVFGVGDAIREPERGLIVLVETAAGSRFGLVVDGLIGQQQVVIKSLQDNFVPIPGISGGTILGDGRIALILDIEQLNEREELAA